MTGLKNILVHLDSGERTAVRLALAVALAAQHGARLVGLFAQRGEARSIGVVASWPSDQYRAAADASRQDFAKATATLADPEWRDANRGGDTEITRVVTAMARGFDLIILGQHQPDAPAPIPPDLAEQVILHSGRPALVIPYAGPVPSLGARPLVAWNAGREAARALNDALPLLTGAGTAWVLSLGAADDAADPVTQLHCHGVTAQTEMLSVEGIGRMDMLLNRAADLGCDLLVMGAYGHYGFPQLNRGGGTRHILQHMTVPVLLSH
jgi:nucleotide-binding universal stress UspA family protein